MTVVERKSRPRIDLQKAIEHHAKTEELAESILSTLQPQMESNMRLYGKVFMGSAQKSVTDEEDQVHLVDWTVDELMENGDAMQDEQEKVIRARLDKEVGFSMEHQARFLRGKSKPRGKNLHYIQDGEQIREFVSELRREVRNSKEQLTFPWITRKHEDHYAAEALEIIRRTVLKPSYILIEGTGEGYIESIPSFDDSEDWDEMGKRLAEIKSLAEDPEDYSVALKDAQRDIAINNPSSYSSKEWKEIIDREKVYLLEYLKARADRTMNRLAEHTDISDRLYNGRKKIFKKKDMEKLKNTHLPVFAIASLIRGVSSLEAIRPSLIATFDTDMTPRQILLALISTRIRIP